MYHHRETLTLKFSYWWTNTGPTQVGVLNTPESWSTYCNGICHRRFFFLDVGLIFFCKFTLQKSNLAPENPPCLRYLPGKVVIFHGDSLVYQRVNPIPFGKWYARLRFVNPTGRYAQHDFTLLDRRLGTLQELRVRDALRWKRWEGKGGKQLAAGRAGDGCLFGKM